MVPSTSIVLPLEPLSAIMARVAYRLIQLDYKNEPGAYVSPARAIGDLARQLHSDGFPALSYWVAGYAFHNVRGTSTQMCKQRMVQRARWAALNREYGKPWARVPAK